jgi:TfoX/Sxy family transcriptional regulator of competence genes
MAFDAELADRVRVEMGGVDGVVELKMFGGWGVTVHGNMAVGVMEGDLIVRVGPEGFDGALASRALAPWVAKGVSYAQSLPPKVAKAKPRAGAASKRRSSR